MYKKDKNLLEQEYYFQLEKLKDICKDLKKAPHWLSLSQKYGLRGSRWFVEHCPNEKVKDYNSFMEYEVGIRPNYLPSKEFVVNSILNFCKENNRDNVFRRDFENGLLGFSIDMVHRIFGTMGNMKKELGMKPHVGGMERKKTLDYIKNCINLFCEFFTNTKLNKAPISLMNNFFSENNMEICCQTCHKKLKDEEGISLREYLYEHGVNMIDSGCGFYHSFEDGEIVYSVYEYEFSLYLRNKGFKFNYDYFRGVRYNTFDNDVPTNVDIDYIINKDNNKIFIEVAGFLRDYENFYLENKIINKSKSKEEYKQKLKYKESILKRNDLNYLFLFPKKYRDFRSIIEEKCFLLNL